MRRPPVGGLSESSLPTRRIGRAFKHGDASAFAFSSVRAWVVVLAEDGGAVYGSGEVVRDGNLVTSRKPDDLPAFCRTIIQALTEAKT